MKKSSFIGRTVKHKFGDKVGVVVDGYEVNKDNYTDVFKVLYSDKSVEVLIFHETTFQYEPWPFHITLNIPSDSSTSTMTP